MHAKRVCIVGTAPSWRDTPWADVGLEVWSLNDAMMLGLPRASRWFEIHPLDKMVFRPKTQKFVKAEDIPPGHYMRPEGHIEWLREQAKTIPVYLQQVPPEGWPGHAQRFPIERVTEAFGADYWASGPSYMLALALLEGYTEIWITGIHLSTEAEYREQRPQWEFLLGRALGRNVTHSRIPGFRVYDGAIRLVLPDACPILTHGWKYGYEPKPTPPPNPYAAEWKATQKEKHALVKDLVYWTKGPAAKRIAMERLARLEVIEQDIQNQTAKRQSGATLVVQVA